MVPPIPSVAVWTLAVQVGTVALIALFFAVLATSVRLLEVRVWAFAWAAELLAVGAALGALSMVAPEILAYPDGGLLPRTLLAVYAAAKTTFVLLVVRGVQLHATGGGRRWAGTGRMVVAAALWGAALGAFAPYPAFLLVFVWGVVAILLVDGARWAFAERLQGRSHWLAWMLLGVGVLFGAYALLMAPMVWGRPPVVVWLFDYSSLFDAGGDLLLALAVLVALESSRSEALERMNADLLLSHERLRRLVDVDPLTGLANRRALRATIEALTPDSEAALLFLDVDDFKRVNDHYGHDVGDAGLQRVAAVLAEHFRPGDGLFRWGGDEFLVVAPGLAPRAAEERVAGVRLALARQEGRVPPLTLSVGQSRLHPIDLDVERALREADAAMYADKRGREAS